MNNLDKQYQELLQDILDNGITKTDRTGTGTISVFGRQIRHKMSEGFPLLTTKKMAWKTMVVELLWFIRGETNIQYLIENGCHIWDGDAYQNYLKNSSTSLDGMRLSKEEFIHHVKNNKEWGKKWGDLGPIYGKQWRNWNGKPEQITDYKGGEINPYFCDCQERIEDGNSKVRKKNEGVDQIANLIEQLKSNPDSRRLMVSAWNVGELNHMVLPPCHYGFQIYTRELSLYERRKIVLEGDPYGIQPTDNWTQQQLEDCKKQLDEWNTPTRAISLMWNQRSVDTFLGLPFNIASYGLLLEIIAKEVNMIPDELIGNLGDTHLYLNHIEQAKEQIGRTLTSIERHELLKQAMGIEAYNYAVNDLVPFGGGLSEYFEIHKIPYHTREPYELPTLKINGEEPSIIEKTNYWRAGDFEIVNYKSHPSIKAPLSN